MSRDTNNNNNLVMFLSDGRNLELNAATVHSEGVSRGIWDEDFGVSRRHRNELHEVPEKLNNNNNRLRKMVD